MFQLDKGKERPGIFFKSMFNIYKFSTPGIFQIQKGKNEETPEMFNTFS